MQINIQQYNKPNNNETCIGICFFRPIEYVNPLLNLNIVIDDLSKSHIPYFIIELLYDNQQPIVKNPTRIVRSSSVLFSKENLWNLLEKNIPDNYSKIIFLDADVRFDNADWFNLSNNKLDEHKVIQPMEYAYRDIHGLKTSYTIEPKNITESIAKAINQDLNIDVSYHYPGFSVGIQRKFFHEIGGFCEYGLGGYGDSLFWGSVKPYDLKFINLTQQLFPEYIDYQNLVSNKCIPNNSIVGYTENVTALHLYHGSHANRRYYFRENYIPKNFQLFHNKDGVLNMKSDKDMIQYWIDRKEDD